MQPKAYIKKLYDQNLSLDLIGWLATITALPIVIKGILRGEVGSPHTSAIRARVRVSEDPDLPLLCATCGCPPP